MSKNAQSRRSSPIPSIKATRPVPKTNSPRKVSRPSKQNRLFFTPPEGVRLSFDIASIGSRAGAQFIDLAITTVATIIILIVVTFAFQGSGNAIEAIVALLFFFIGTPYYIVSELTMNGRTIGKKMLGLRVISRDGLGLSTHQIVVRNLTKEVEVFLPVGFLLGGAADSVWIVVPMLVWIIFVFVVPARNRYNQRIGDIAACTAVILDPRPLLLPDIAREVGATARERFVFTSAQLDAYGAYELQVLERLLRGEEVAKHRKESDAMAKVGARIRAKIGYDEAVTPDKEREFLQSFYVAQRNYLEQKKLMGDSRTDKFHNATRSDSGKVANS
ncbi:RDD family protein [Fulvimarina sp. MAC3]|uniref:RDD family protein n=1 Tax=Fulvimarina sp. MAC3 TaxID=3148887 RepID=UPI0031FCF55E